MSRFVSRFLSSFLVCLVASFAAWAGAPNSDFPEGKNEGESELSYVKCQATHHMFESLWGLAKHGGKKNAHTKKHVKALEALSCPGEDAALVSHMTLVEHTFSASYREHNLLAQAVAQGRWHFKKNLTFIEDPNLPLERRTKIVCCDWDLKTASMMPDGRAGIRGMASQNFDNRSPDYITPYYNLNSI